MSPPAFCSFSASPSAPSSTFQCGLNGETPPLYENATARSIRFYLVLLRCAWWQVHVRSVLRSGALFLGGKACISAVEEEGGRQEGRPRPAAQQPVLLGGSQALPDCDRDQGGLN